MPASRERAPSAYPYLGWAPVWLPARTWIAASSGSSKERRTLAPQSPADRPIRLVWHPLGEMWWGRRGRSIAVVAPPGWETGSGPIALVIAGVLACVGSLLCIPGALRPPYTLGDIVPAGGICLLGGLALFRLAWTRIVEATPRCVRVTLRLGPFGLRREIPLHAVRGAVLQERYVGKGQRHRSKLRYLAEVRVQNALSLTLFPLALPASREPLERVVDRVEALARGRSRAADPI